MDSDQLRQSLSQCIHLQQADCDPKRNRMERGRCYADRKVDPKGVSTGKGTVQLWLPRHHVTLFHVDFAAQLPYASRMHYAAATKQYPKKPATSSTCEALHPG